MFEFQKEDVSISEGENLVKYTKKECVQDFEKILDFRLKTLNNGSEV